MHRPWQEAFRVDQKVVVTLLEAPGDSLEGRVLETNGRTLDLAIKLPLSSGSAIQVGSRNSLLLAEVCACGAQNGEFRASLDLKHYLPDLEELAAITRDWMA